MPIEFPTDKNNASSSPSTPYFNTIEETKDAFCAKSPIIQSARAARTIYETMRQDHLRRINLYREIESLIQGSPPYNPQDLRQAGLDHVANFNDMSARAVYERACLAYWNLLQNADCIINFTLRLRTPDGQEPPELKHFAGVMARNWDFVIKTEWPSFLTNLESTTAQLVKFGVSPIVFPDEKDFKWRMVELNRFYVPNQSQIDIDTLGTVMIETDYPLSYLWQTYLEYENVPSEDAPWDIDELGKLLVHATNSILRGNSSSATAGSAVSGASGAGGHYSSPSTDMLDLQKRVLSGDVSLDSFYADTVRIISFFQKEYEGKISHYMFHRYFGSDSSKFLYSSEAQYENISRAIIIFTMNPGEFTIHANRGLGHKIFSLAQAKIQVACSLVDQAKWASTPIVKSGSLTTKDVEQIKFYPGVPTNIGTCELQQNNLGANVQNSVAVAQFLKSEVQYNVSYSGSDPGAPDPDQASISPSQARLMATREFSILKNFIAHFQRTVDVVFQNMTSVMLTATKGDTAYDTAQLWKERCIEDGVPQELFDISRRSLSSRTGLPPHVHVTATRVAGSGSQTAEILGLQELQAIVGYFGPKAEIAFKRRFIAAAVGHESVEEFMQDENNPDETAGGASLAGVENAVMAGGKGAVFSPDNEHRAHFTTHMALAEQTIQGMQQQQMDVVQADSIFTVLVPHMGEHLQALGQNVFAQQFFAQAKPAFDQVARQANLNHKNAAKVAQDRIRQQQEQQAQQQQVMNDEQLKNLQVTNEERRKDMKLQAQLKRQEQAGQAKEQALERK